MKPKLAFIDHSFHKKTKSTYFLRDILEKDFEIFNIWDESWQGNGGISTDEVNELDCEYVLFFQVLPPIKALKNIKHKIIWVPMYDDIVWLPRVFWNELSTVKIKVISFCEELSRKLDSAGLDNICVRYYHDPSQVKLVSDYRTKRVFFWQRTNLSYRNLLSIIGDQKIDEVVLKLVADPNFEPVKPSKKDIERYNIKIIDQNTSKEEYMNQLTSCNIFLAPREYEGIGMSFIEAMSAGMAVMAINRPTMNEYIEDGKNGYLFNKSGLIDLDNFQQVGENARQSCIQGYKKWSSDKEKVIRFITGKFQHPAKYNPAWSVDKAIYFVRNKIFGQLYRLKLFVKHNLLKV